MLNRRTTATSHGIAKKKTICIVPRRTPTEADHLANLLRFFKKLMLKTIAKTITPAVTARTLHHRTRNQHVPHAQNLNKPLKTPWCSLPTNTLHTLPH